MKRKYFLVILFLILAIFLNGCVGGVVTPATDEAKVKGVIQDYWLALSNRQYELAKSYCIPFGVFYNLVEEYQSIPYYGSTVKFIPYFNWVEVTGNNATVNMNITITVCFEDICSDEILYNYSMYLTKSSGVWKLI